MLPLLGAVLGSLCSLVRTRKDVALENLALRRELVVLRRDRPKGRSPYWVLQVITRCLTRLPWLAGQSRVIVARRSPAHSPVAP